MIRPINRNPLTLNQAARPATQADAGVAQDLLATMAAHSAECVGMAGNMIGKNIAVIVAQLGPVPVAMLNPVITATSGAYTTEEGCLSLTGTREARRFHQITVTWRTLDWQEKTANFSDFNAQIIQHECDHLKGILI